jgi:hypothetical protein
MALVEIFHVVADQYDVSSSADITEGMVVMQNSSGEIIAATGGASTRALGVAGDTKSSAPGLPAVSADAGVNDFVNRVSDPFVNETAASGKMTVYHAGGTFATDQYDTGVTFAVGEALYSNASGALTNVSSANSQVVGTVVAVPGPFPSGVPGTDTGLNGDISLGTFIQFKLEL